MEMTKMLNTKKQKKKGFTLVEVIIVIAIIAILAAIAIPKFGSAQKDAKISTDVASAKTIANAASMLITKGNITLPEAETEYGLEQDFNGKTIAGELQNVPKPKAVSGDFKVKIDKEGNVKVIAGGKEVYPNLETGYGGK